MHKYSGKYERIVARLLSAGWKLGYKVTSKNMQSSNAPASSAIQYKIGQYSSPRMVAGPLCVFGNKYCAKSFASRLVCESKIFVVAYKPDPGSYAYSGYGYCVHLNSMPHSTALAKKVFVAKQIV